MGRDRSRGGESKEVITRVFNSVMGVRSEGDVLLHFPGLYFLKKHGNDMARNRYSYSLFAYRAS